jgi:hypothetical protein
MLESGNEILESQSSTLYDAWRESVTKYLAQQSTTVSLADLNNHVSRPAGVHPSVSLVDVLITDPLQRFAISGEGDSTRVRRIFRVDDDEIKDLVAKWRNSLANYLSNLTCTVGLSDIGSNVSRPYRLPSSVKLIDVLRTDPLNRFIITGEGNGIRAKYNFHLTEEQVSSLVEQWRDNICRFLTAQPSSVGLSDIGSNVARPFCLPNSVKLLDTLQNDPLGRFAISGEGSNMRARRVFRPDDPEVFEAVEDWRRAIGQFLLIHPLHTTLSDIGFNVARPLHLPNSIKLLDVMKADPYQRFLLEGEGNSMRASLSGPGKAAVSASYGKDSRLQDLTGEDVVCTSDNFRAMQQTLHFDESTPSMRGPLLGQHGTPSGEYPYFSLAAEARSRVNSSGATIGSSNTSVESAANLDHEDNGDGSGMYSHRSSILATRSSSIGSQSSVDSLTVLGNSGHFGSGVWAASSPTAGHEWYPGGNTRVSNSSMPTAAVASTAEAHSQPQRYVHYQNVRLPQPTGPRGSGSLLSRQPAYAATQPNLQHSGLMSNAYRGEVYGEQPRFAPKQFNVMPRQPNNFSHSDTSRHPVTQVAHPPHVQYLEPPSDFLCPLTQLLMTDPVQAADGVVYDRRSIEQWMRTSNRSPVTGRDFQSRKLVPNVYLRQSIENFARKRPQLQSPHPQYAEAHHNFHSSELATSSAPPRLELPSGSVRGGFEASANFGGAIGYGFQKPPAVPMKHLPESSPLVGSVGMNDFFLSGSLMGGDRRSMSPMLASPGNGANTALDGSHAPPGLRVLTAPPASSFSFLDDNNPTSLSSYSAGPQWSFLQASDEANLLGGSLNDLALGMGLADSAKISETGYVLGMNSSSKFIAKLDDINTLEPVSVVPTISSLEIPEPTTGKEPEVETVSNPTVGGRTDLIPLSVWLPDLFAGFDGPLVNSFLESMRDECGFMTVQDLLEAQANSQLTFEFMKSACAMKLGHFNRLIKGLENCKSK